ncbi:MAG TPA: flagellar protein FlgN [Nocardioidaceae bacterium]|jgi:hypothetical protein|nr:flagellar protein FlgN [Nocardioidaceae bacterium]
MENLSLILWRERELLDTLLFKLEEEQLVLAGGRTRWLNRAAREVELVLETVRETEALRAVAVDQEAAVLGLGPNPSLRALIDAVGEPWRTILEDHRQAFLQVTQELTAMAEANRDLVTTGLRTARETLLALDENVTGYAHDGSAVVPHARPRLVDRSL